MPYVVASSKVCKYGLQRCLYQVLARPGDKKLELLYKFIGTERWKSFFEALRSQVSREQEACCSPQLFISVCALCLLPGLILYIEGLFFPGNNLISLLAITLICGLSFFVRRHFVPPTRKAFQFWKNVSITHTAVALGCIPAVIVFLVSPAVIAEHQEVIKKSLSPLSRTGSQQISLLIKIIALFGFSAWAAITEEIIYRYCLISLIRRSRIQLPQKHKDILAVILSASFFAGAHVFFWGLPAAFALFGLGVGFSLAYIATEERITPLLFYHFLFDLLSLSIALAI